MHVLIVGGEGQLGRALHTIYAQRSEDQVTIWDRPGQDISQPAIADALHSLQPDIVINTAAWTNVDAAEEQPDTAYTVNALGPKYLAEGCRHCRALLVQISTNEVFPGAPGHIYREYDLPRAGSVYARSKLAGERAVQLHAERWQIVRIAWLFGAAQGNFPHEKHSVLFSDFSALGGSTPSISMTSASIVSGIPQDHAPSSKSCNGNITSPFYSRLEIQPQAGD